MSDQRRQDPDLEKPKLRYSLWKFIPGAVLLWILTAAAKFIVGSFRSKRRDREIERAELERIGVTAKLVEPLLRLFFGDDIFISYARSDAAGYAAALADSLTQRGLSCRLDQWGARPGREVPADILRALRRSAMLVILGTEGATQSVSVARELREFLPTKRLIVPVDIDGSLLDANWWPLVAGLAVSRENDAQAKPKKPSDAVVDRIWNSIRYTTRNRRLQWLTAGAAVVLVALVITAIMAGKRAAVNLREASKQAELAAIRTIANRASFGSGQHWLLESMALAIEAAKRADSLGEQVLEADSALRENVALLPCSRGRLASCPIPDPKQFNSMRDGNREFVRVPATNNDNPLEIPLDESTGVGASRLSPDGRYVALGLQDYSSYERVRGGEIYPGYVELWDIRARRRVIRVMPTGFMEVRSIAFSPNGDRLAAGGLGFGPRGNLIGRVLIWSAHRDGWQQADFQSADELLQEEGIRSIAVGNGARYVATNAFSNAFIWQRRLGRYQLVGQLPFPNDTLSDIAFGANSDSLITRATGPSVACETWDLTGFRFTETANHQVLASLGFGEAHPVVTKVQVRVDEDDSTLQIIDSSSRDVTPSELREVEHIRSAKASFDGRYAAVLVQEGGDDEEGPQELLVWDIPRARKLSFPQIRFISAYEFSRDGALAIGDLSGDVRIVTLETGNTRRIQAYAAVTVMTFSDDAKYLATGDTSGFVHVWKRPSLDGIARLSHTGEVRAVAFNSNSDRVAVRTELEDFRFAAGDEEEQRSDKQRIWVLRTRDLLAEACARFSRFSYGRELSYCTGK